MNTDPSAPDLGSLQQWLVQHHGDTVDTDRLTVIRDEIEHLSTAGISGAVVELGCYQGAMALWMRAVLDATGQADRPLHVYDSFEGLPLAGPRDPELFPPGFLKAEPHQVETLHHEWGFTAPTIHPGWFADTLGTQLPAEIAFAYLDGDYYESISTCLDACVPRLGTNGILIVDDYADVQANPRAWDGLPGVKAACDDYFGDPSPLEVILGSGDLAFGRYTPNRAVSNLRISVRKT